MLFLGTNYTTYYYNLHVINSRFIRYTIIRCSLSLSLRYLGDHTPPARRRRSTDTTFVLFLGTNYTTYYYYYLLLQSTWELPTSITQPYGNRCFCFELNGFVCFGFLMGRNPFGEILIAGCKWTNYFGTPRTFIQAARIHIYKVMYVLAYS